jgi:hypothetical protein
MARDRKIACDNAEPQGPLWSYVGHGARSEVAFAEELLPGLHECRDNSSSSPRASGCSPPPIAKP